MKNKLLLLDGMAITYRAYYALSRNPRITSKGLNTSAIMGFTSTLFELIQSQKPTHIAVAFDLPAPTFRHERFAEYKANRDAMPEDIQLALPYIREIITAFNISIATCEGYEADDVIGTLAHKAEQHGFEVLMATPDKDFGQLVTENVKIYKFGRMGHKDEIMGVPEILAKFGIQRCEQVADILGLWGDSIDNIPGIPGVGEKKATQLVNEFDSVENLVQNYSKIKNDKLRELVGQYTEQALLSKELATIALDAPIDFDEEDLRLTAPDFERLKELFNELEFRNLANRIFTHYSTTSPELITLMQSPAPQANTTAKKSSQPTLFDNPDQLDLFGGQATDTPTLTEEKQYRTIASEKEIATFVNTLKDSSLFSIHFLQILDRTIGVALAGEGIETTLIDLSKDTGLEIIKPLLDAEKPTKVCLDLKQTKKLLHGYGMELHGDIFCTTIAHYLLHSESRHTADYIFRSYLSQEIFDIDTFTKKVTKNDVEAFVAENRSTLANAVCHTAELLLQTYPLLDKELKDTGAEKLYREVEIPLVDVLLSMENEGVRIDTDYLKNYSEQLQKELQGIEKQIFEYAEGSFNINSPKQLGEVLYEKLKIVDKPPKTATKQYSTAEDVLLKLADKHAIVPLILEYRSLTKLIGTYLDSFPKLISPTDQRLHTIFNQTVTATGRLSSSNPNLQNIPIRTQRGREIRKAFVPRNDEYTLLAADYSQIELRIIASLSGDEHLKTAFVQNLDIHASTAAKIYKLDIGDVSPDLRRNAKSVNFGIIYGISAFGLAEQLGIPRKEAQELIDEYFVQYPDIKKYIDNCIATAREHGYAQTMLGRRRPLPDINSRNNNIRSFAERNAVNMPIQGTSADMIKIAMNNIYSEFVKRGLKSKMILQVHDELVFDVFKPELDEVKDIVSEMMKNALPLSVPIELGIETGNNWLEAH